MYRALKSFSEVLPKETRYMPLMDDRVVAKEKGKTSIMLLIKYLPAALLCSFAALRHWAKISVMEIKS
jgi:hypothetical protein